MPQQTNLNISPYFDDFDENKNFHKVLFKPGFPVQARELTTLQSILQDQIEKFGDHLFKEGSQIIPGALGIDLTYYGIKIDSSFFGVPVSSYIDKLIGVTIKGATSGVTAKVSKVLDSTESEEGFVTLYIKYVNSNPNSEFQVFQSGESLITNSNIIYGSTLIQAGNTFANTISTSASFIASAATINDGVYFVRGNFVKVGKQTIILDQYNSVPSVRIGLLVKESIVNSMDDPSLNDNSQGFSNYAAPGADRLKIDLELFKKDFNDIDNENFVEIARLNKGVTEKFVDRSQYNLIRDELARRTYEESGDYIIKPFEVFPKETLNNYSGNQGLYDRGTVTPEGNDVSDDLLTYKIMPGKAYVKGYDIETISPKYLDVEKPRNSVGVPTSGINIENGTTVKINNVSGLPLVGFDQNSIIELRSERRNETTGGPGIGGPEINHVGFTTVGTARVVDIISNKPYENNSSQYQLYLYDIQTYSQVGINTLAPFDNHLSAPAFIEGKSSGATGFLKYDAFHSQNVILTLTNVSGQFIKNESLVINGVEINKILTTSVNDFNLGDVKSVFQSKDEYSGLGTHFNADTVLDKVISLSKVGSEFQISGNMNASAGILTCTNTLLSNIVRPNDIVIYSNPNPRIVNGVDEISDPQLTYNKVEEVDSNGKNLTIVGVSTVTGVNRGSLILGGTQTTSVGILRPTFNSRNGEFFTRLKYENVSSIDLTQGDINLTYQFAVDSSSGSFTIDLNSIAEFQDEENISWKDIDGNYELVNESGQIIPIFRNNTVVTGSKVITISGINDIIPGIQGSVNSTFIATLNKKSVRSKQKKFNTIGDLTISRSKYTSAGIGTTTLNNGLVYSSVYGTRVEDQLISLNCPDVYRVYGIYESKDTSDPKLPSLVLTDVTGSLPNVGAFVIGETIQSLFGVAKALVVSKDVANNRLEIQYMNDEKFLPEESIFSLTSSITAKILTTTIGDNDIFGDYYFDSGIRSEYYDYSKIIRSSNFEPKRKIRVIYQKFSTESTDRGDFYSANSYPSDIYQSISFTSSKGNLIRNSDLIDFRPKVKDYDLATNTRSPFEFDGKDFSNSSDHTQFTVTPKTNLEIAFNHYVGRIDKIYLTRNGKFTVQKGVASRTPREPSNEDSSLLLGTAYLPPYVFDAKQVKFIKSDHKRYTMKDIAKLESRLSNVEFYTSLSLLETDTNSLTIKDPTTGLDRFKSGFYVDNFGTLQLANTKDPSWGCSIDTKNNLCRPSHNTPAIDLQLGSSAIPGVTSVTTPNADLAFVTDLGNPNVKKTGDLITLDYDEEEYQSQISATRTENVNPFNISNWSGSIELEPESDVWVATNQLEVNAIKVEGSYQAFMDSYPPEADGWSAIQWNAWEENIAGRTEESSIGPVRETSRIQGESNWEKTGVEDWSRVHIMSNGAGRVMNSGDNELANALIDSLSEAIAPSTVDSNGIRTFRIDADSPAGQRLIRRFGSPDASGILIARNAGEETRYQFVEGGAGNALGQGFLRNLQRQGIRPGTQEALELQQVKFERGGGARFGTADSGIGNVEIARRRTDTVLTEQDTTITTRREFNRTGVQYQVTESIDIQKLGNKVVSRDIIPFMRIRNIEFISKRLKPLTRVYPFFDGVNFNSFIIPKLLEVTNVSGEFEVGETVQGLMPEDNPDIVGDGTNPRIRFRLAKANHKYGPYNKPTATYTNIPYDPDSTMESDYSESSSILNVDTFGLSSIDDNGLGWVGIGMKLTGLTSGAQATISGLRLVTDENGSVRGCLFIPDSSVVKNPKFETGTKTFRLTDSPTNSSTGGFVNTSAERNFFAQGELENLQQDEIHIRNATVETRNVEPQQRIDIETRTETTTNIAEEEVVEDTRWIDPLCQSFITGDGDGVFISSIDIYFRTKSEAIPITLQIRSLRNGIPTQTIPAFGEVTLEPENVNVFDATGDGTIVSTRFTFPSLVYLQANREYGITLLSNSDDYTVYIARMGEIDIFSSTDDDSSTQNIVSQQPSAGVLFKSQNGSTWSPNQFEDLAYKINKAKFKETNGTVRFYSPILSEDNNHIRRLRDNPIITGSRQIKIGITSSIAEDHLSSISPGVAITQGGNTNFEGRIVGLGGSMSIDVTGSGLDVPSYKTSLSVNIDDPGVGIIPLAGNGRATYENISLTSATGSGATCSIVVENGVVGIVTVFDGGTGYQVGQRLSIDQTNFSKIGGETPKLSVVNLSTTNTLFVDNVQGNYNPNNEIQYIDSTGIGVTLVTQMPNIASVFPDNTRDGLHMNVLFHSHGMHSSNNLVRLSNIRADVKELILLDSMTKTSTDDIIIAETGNTSDVDSYMFFENLEVSDTNPGYVKINNEIIRYTSINSNMTGLSGITRGVFNTIPSSHTANNYVEKYEFNGICLARLNTQHNFANVSVSIGTSRTLDDYFVKIDTSGILDGSTTILADRSGSGSLPKLFFSETKRSGGVNVKSSKNMQFEILHPNVQTFTPGETTIDANVRTISATSIGAYENEVSQPSFEDMGFEPVVLNENNYFDSPRMVASRVNEEQFLADLPGSRSLTLELNLSTKHKDLSPVVDITRVNAILSTNRINNPVKDFASNGDIMNSFTEPHSAVYLTRPIRLEQPATSIKLMLLGNRPSGTDIRALYKIFRDDGPSNPAFELFPGYNNLGNNSEILDPRNNNGLPDTFVPINGNDNEYSDYEFTMDNLPEYSAYQIKIIFTSTNQAIVPKIRDLRAIALA
jgi:hypothetical protein